MTKCTYKPSGVFGDLFPSAVHHDKELPGANTGTIIYQAVEQLMKHKDMEDRRETIYGKETA